MVFGMIHVKDSLLLMGKVWSPLDFPGILETSHGLVSVVGFAAAGWGETVLSDIRFQRSSSRIQSALKLR